VGCFLCSTLGCLWFWLSLDGCCVVLFVLGFCLFGTWFVGLGGFFFCRMFVVFVEVLVILGGEYCRVPVGFVGTALCLLWFVFAVCGAVGCCFCCCGLWQLIWFVV